MEPIQISFTHTEEEYLSAARMLFWQSREMLVRLAIFYVCILVGVGGLSFLSGFSLPLWIIGGFCVVLGVALFRSVTIDMPRRYFRGDPKFREEYHLVFTDSGIEFKTKSITASYAWSLYTKVTENDRFYLLLYGKNINQISIIPKRAFRDSRQEAVFRELLRRHIGEGVSQKELGNQEYVPSSLEPPDWR
jgi:YcxB-like protein